MRRGYLAAINLVVFCGLLAGPAPVAAQQWRILSLDLPAKPKHLYLNRRGRGLNRIRIETVGGHWLFIADCSGKPCIKTSGGRPPQYQPPKGALPDAVSTTGRRNISRAWLADPTRRYRHGVLGDDIESSTLVALDKTRREFRLKLDVRSVFEDRRVRIADLDGDGADELVVVKSYLARGAARAVAALGTGGVGVIAETPAIGQAHRWLNPAGIADFDGDGRPEIAIVVTPHIGGRLEFWEYRGRKLTKEMALQGFSNHAIGSRIQAMSAVADFDGDGVADLALPSDTRDAIRIISFAGGKAAEPARIPLAGRVVTEILAIKQKGVERPLIVAGLDTGKLVILIWR